MMRAASRFRHERHPERSTFPREGAQSKDPPRPETSAYWLLVWLRVLLAVTAPVAMLAGMVLLPPRSSGPTYRGVHTLNADATSLRLAYEAGFDTIVQLFSWRQIEPTKGEYHWQYPDDVVRGADYYGLNLVVRLDQHPQWAAGAPLAMNAPPSDTADFERFAGTVAARYRGRVLGYIIWNEPNLAVEWGGQRPDPAGYVALLQAAHRAIKAADPGALVVSAGLASTGGHGDTAMDDRAYLQSMYEAGAARYFDALGAHPYGFAYPPDDPRGSHEGLNMARVADLRDIMVQHGDGRKPVWATEMGWTVQGEGASAWQTVSEQEQAGYLAQAFSDAPRKWPWLEMLAVWNLETRQDTAWEGYNLLDAARRPRPAYTVLQALFRPTPLTRLAREAESALRRHKEPSEERAQVLAPDSIIHLGDGDFSTPWRPLHGASNPSTDWAGTAYVRDPRAGSWTLTMRLMQSNVWGNFVWINGDRLEPPFPPEDFSNSWVTVSWPVPDGVLRVGPNEIRITLGEGLSLLQGRPLNRDDLQFKDMFLRSSR